MNNNSIILNGGSFTNVSLKGTNRNEYIARCNRIYCKGLTEKDCNTIISQHLVALYKVTESLLESYNMSGKKELYLNMMEKFQNIRTDY